MLCEVSDRPGGTTFTATIHTTTNLCVKFVFDVDGFYSKQILWLAKPKISCEPGSKNHKQKTEGQMPGEQASTRDKAERDWE